MRDRGRISRLVWLVLIAAFAAIAGGGCGGSSSHNGGGDLEGNVRPIGETDHPLYDALKDHYLEMPNGTVIIGNKITPEELAEAMPEIKAAFDEGNIIGKYAPTQADIAQLRSMLGVDIFDDKDAGISAEEAGDEADPEFYMIKRHDGIIFQHTVQYVDGDTPGVKQVEEGPTAVLPATDDVPSSDVAPPAATNEEIREMKRVRDKLERYPEMATSVVAWNGKVVEHAASVKAGSASARDSISAAANINYLTEISTPVVITASRHFGDKPDGYKFATVHITSTIYSCYSIEKDQNFYLIDSSSSINCINMAANEYVYRHWNTGFAGEDHVQNSIWSYSWNAVLSGISGLNDGTKLRMYAYAPHDMGDGEQGIERPSHTIDGPVTFFKDQQTEMEIEMLADGVDISDEKSYDVKNYDISDMTDGASPGVKYSFTPPGDKCKTRDYMELNDASDESRNFTSSESWIWMVARSANAYKLKYTVSLYNLHKSGRQCFFHVAHGDDHISSSGWSGYEFTVDLPVPPRPIEVSTTSIPADWQASTSSFDLRSAVKWTMSSNADWVHLGETSGDKTGAEPMNIDVKIDANEGSSPRSAEIIVRPAEGLFGQQRTITVWQKPRSKTLEVSPSSISTSGMGGQFKITLSSVGSWTASSNHLWVKLSETSGGPTGSKPKEITVTVDRNHFLDPRDATITIRNVYGEEFDISIWQERAI